MRRLGTVGPVAGLARPRRPPTLGFVRLAYGTTLISVARDGVIRYALYVVHEILSHGRRCGRFPPSPESAALYTTRVGTSRVLPARHNTRRLVRMATTRQLRQLLNSPGVIRSLGAHDVLTARLIEAAGLETVFLESGRA